MAKNLLSLLKSTKFTSRKVLYVIGLTSVFWFSLNVLLLIANNEAALSSLDSLSLGLGRVRRDSHFMADVNGIKPLAPANKKHYPWQKNAPSNKKASLFRDYISGREKIRDVYDVSAKVNLKPGLGENGEAAYLQSEEDKKLSEQLFANHSFNSILSDKISLDRTLLDVRGEK